MLPLVAASIVLGSAKELLGINHVASFIDSFVSYCHHSSVETIQRFFLMYICDTYGQKHHIFLSGQVIDQSLCSRNV